MKNIKSIQIKNSRFYEDNLIVHFDEKMNCIMGGRGTGKSTILYFLKSALCPESHKGKAHEILRNNLGTGEIVVEVESSDGALYQIVKTFNEEPQPYRHPTHEFTSLNRIYSQIECDFYETNNIEEIGRSPIDRLELIDKKIKSEIQSFKEELRKVQLDLDANAQDIKTYNYKIKHLQESLTQYTNVREEILEFQNSEPVDIKPDEKQAFESADYNEKVRSDEKRFFHKSLALYNDLLNQINLSRNDLNDIYSSAVVDREKFINKSLLEEILAFIESRNRTIQEKFGEIAGLIIENRTQLNITFNGLSTIHEGQQAEFVQLKQKFEKNREYFNRYNVLTNRLKDSEVLEHDIREINHKKVRLLEERRFLIEKFNDIKNQIFSKRLLAIQEINELLNGDIKITLKFSGIVTEFEDKLREALKGSGLKYNELVFKIVDAFRPDQFVRLIQERNVNALKQIAGIDQVRSEALISALFDSEYIYQVESIYCEDLPDFKLRIDSGEIQFENYKNSDELSMGQRCTTVLPIIFAVSSNPLIIDQPEDNLDNKYISEKIHDIIRNQKEKRQLIFITHNPNIPVLSESEFNLFLNYEDRRSKIENSGTIDEVKQQIIKILEGGETAFKIRQDKYNIL